MFDFKLEILVDGKKVTIDNSLLQFNEQTLNQFLQNMHAYYSYYGAQLALAEYELLECERLSEVKFAEKFEGNKEAGGTDKFAEARTKQDPDYNMFLGRANLAKRNMKLLQQYLKAWDKAHDNSQSMGHNLRKEMEKLSNSIRMTTQFP